MKALFSIVYVYFKDGKIKIFDNSHGKSDYEEAIKDGYRHVSTVNASVFIEYLYNNKNEIDFNEELESILITSPNLNQL